jgi:hypothetical protein
MKCSVWVLLAMLLGGQASADQAVKNLLDHVMGMVPTPCAVWAEAYERETIDTFFFSPVLVKSGTVQEYRVARSKLIAADPGERLVWCYYIALPLSDELPLEVTPAGGQEVRYIGSGPRALSQAEVQSRVAAAEAMLSEYAHLEERLLGLRF